MSDKVNDGNACVDYSEEETTAAFPNVAVVDVALASGADFIRQMSRVLTMGANGLP